MKLKFKLIFIIFVAVSLVITYFIFINNNLAKDNVQIGADLIDPKTTKNSENVYDEEEDFRKELKLKREATKLAYDEDKKLREIKGAFYGRIIDQYNQPVVGVDIEFMWLNAENGSAIETSVKSDEKGLFSLDYIPSHFVSVTYKKRGYHFSYIDNRKQYWFIENNEGHPHYIPNPNKPLDIVLQKMGATEPLIFIWKDQDVEDISKPVYYSLSTGKIVTEKEADLKITYRTWNQSLHKFYDNEFTYFDWEANIECMGAAGIIIIGVEHIDSKRRGYGSTDLRKHIEAPGSGYFKKFKIDGIRDPMKKIKTTISHRRLLVFYRTREAKYGIGLLTFEGTWGIRYESLLNPSGSQNIEYDPDKITKLYR